MDSDKTAGPDEKAPGNEQVSRGFCLAIVNMI
jgi:hypothetical protein